MDCAAVKPVMEALVSGTLSSAERESAEQHIAACEGCRLELELVRAVGSQEKSAHTGETDWTIDRIFGSGKSPGNPAPAPEESPQKGPSTEDRPISDVEMALSGQPSPAEPAPSPPPPERRTVEASGPAGAEVPGAPPESSDESAEVLASWDFEPADAKPEITPPEKSLFFAEEALARRKESARKKHSKFRVLLWGTGGTIAAALLGLFSWVALHVTSGPKDRDQPLHPPPRAEAPAQVVAPEETPSEPPSAVEPSSASPAPSQSSEPRPAEPGSPSPPGSTVEDSPARESKLTASATSQPAPLPEARRAPGSPATRSAPLTPRTAPAPKQTTPERPVRSGRITVVEETAEGLHARSATPPEASDRGDESPPSARPRASEAGPAPVTEEERQSPAWSAPRAGGSTTASRPETGSPRVSAAPEPAAESPPEPPKVSTPLDRLHLATLSSEEEGDLAGLRKLRSTWKGFIGKTVGPDRARAKRELADCLWAIQALTGKRSDQKGALAAYREYLLSAPAGGADARTVSRLRQLEDALTEKQ